MSSQFHRTVELDSEATQRVKFMDAFHQRILKILTEGIIIYFEDLIF